ncbi:hypothetical protein CRG98_033515 [Punica granatum]|uniref:Uncharacterized protein n=1 Tax=Punica granatum TaxID=22663 RepID=A0A2I0IR22_PUNGR|nr:hypothetical protein CRG98_033515 [Punica granatum]
MATVRDSTWVADTGASFHVTPQRDFFSSYTTGDYGYVRMGNRQSCKIVDTGDICLETELGCKLLLKKLDDEGYSNEFSNGRWKLSKGSLIMARGQKTDTLYRLRAKHNSGQINVVEDYPIELWHRRLGHISKKEHSVEEVPGEYEETTTGGGPQVDDDVTTDDTGSQLQLEPADNLPRRSYRVKRPSTRYPPHEYVLLTDGGEPKCYDEAVAHEHKEHWLKAMNEEMNSLSENHTYDLVKLPQGKRALKNKWIYRLKTENSRPRYKARLVVKGFNQKKGVDFEEIFSPVVKMSSIRVVLALAASLNLEIEQLDVKTTFLHGDLEEEIYMEQPEGFRVKEKYIEKILDRFNMGNAKLVSSPLASHFKLSSKQCPSEKEKEEMKKVPYSSAVGSLMYVMVCTRPDIAHSIGVVSHFLSNPGKKHWNAVKWILRGSYLMAFKASKVYRFVYNGSRIHCGDRGLQGDVVVAKVFAGVELEARKSPRPRSIRGLGPPISDPEPSIEVAGANRSGTPTRSPQSIRGVGAANRSLSIFFL